MSNISIKATEDTKTSGQMPPLYVGMEIETGLSESDAHIQWGKRTFGIEYGHTHGLERNGESTGLVGGVRVTIGGVNQNRYEKPGYLADFYHDGSVGLEFVTRPVLTEKIDVLKTAVFDKLLAYARQEGTDLEVHGRSGLHLTFVLDHHQCLSVYNQLWAKNVQQLARLFYPDLINWRYTKTDTKTRPLGYRRIFGRVEVMDVGRSNHHSAISFRYCNNIPRDGVWGIEVRIPDGTNNWAQVAAYVKFWRAFFELAYHISKSGMLEFSQDIWDYNQSWYSIFECRAIRDGDTRMTTKGKGRNKLVLTKMLAPFMKEPLPANHITTWVEWYNKQQMTDAEITNDSSER